MFLQAPGFESLVPFIGVSKQGPCFTAVEEEVNSRPPRKGALQEFFHLLFFDIDTSQLHTLLPASLRYRDVCLDEACLCSSHKGIIGGKMFSSQVPYQV